MLSAIAKITAIVAVGLGFVWVLSYGWSKNEIVECEKWLEQSRQYVGWYSTNWQREQCKAHGYELPERYQR